LVKFFTLKARSIFVPNYSKQPFLTANDEEYTMLIEVTEEFEKQKLDKTIREKSGSPTEIVIRNHLLRKNLNLSTIPDVTIEGSKIKNGLLLLKIGVDPNQKTYPSNQVKMVIEVKNNAVAGKTLKNGKTQDPNRFYALNLMSLKQLLMLRILLLPFFRKRCCHPKRLTNGDLKKKRLENKTAKSSP
jgi:hypothetical protein